MSEYLTPDKQKLVNLSRFVRIAAIATFALGVLGIFAIIFVSQPVGFSLFSLISSIVIGFVWYQSSDAYSMGKEMLKFESLEDYLKYLEAQNSKDDFDE